MSPLQCKRVSSASCSALGSVGCFLSLSMTLTGRCSRELWEQGGLRCVQVHSLFKAINKKLQTSEGQERWLVQKDKRRVTSLQCPELNLCTRASKE